MDPIRVLIADDQRMVRAGLRLILETEPGIEVVAEAADGAEVSGLCERHEPHVVLMDIRMPGLNGIEATRSLRSLQKQPHVLILTTFDLDEYVYESLRAGASGFLLKDASPEALIDAIQTVATGDAVLSPAVTRRIIEQFSSMPPPAPDPALNDLTARERQVLALVARGLSNAGIALELVISETTVKTHVSHLLLKLDLADRIHAVIFAYEQGLVRPGDRI